MIFKHILAATAAILVFPVAAQAETIVHTTTETTTVQPGYKETTVLKGYKVTTTQPKGSSAPVIEKTYHTKGTVFIPADQVGIVPVTPDGVIVHETEYHFEKSYKGPTSFND